MPPRPPRRPGTSGGGGDLRDERVTKSPPPGLIERAAAVDLTIESRAAAVAAAAAGVVDGPVHDEKTNPHATDFEKMQHRAEKAAKCSKVAADNSIGILTMVVSVSERVASLEGQFGIVVDEFKAMLDAQRQVNTEAATSKIKVGEAGDLAKIDDTVKSKQFWRALLDKWATPIIASVTTAIGVLITALATKGC